MKKAVLKPPEDFALPRFSQSFINTLKDYLEVFPQSSFYYDLPFLCRASHQPVFIIISETDDTERFVATVQNLAATTGFQILSRSDALRVLSRLDLTRFC